MTVKTVTYEYHHMGIPTTEPKEGERYSSTFKMYTSGGGNSEFRIQYHRFEPGCPLHPIIKNAPHVAFKVNSIDEAIKGKTVLLEPYFPLEGFRVAMILNEESQTAIEFIETTLSEDEIWNAPKKKSVLYPEGE
jgi:hypothetical protein